VADKKLYFPLDMPSFLRDTIDLNDKEKMLYLEMLCYQFENEIGYISAHNVCKLLKKSKANVLKIEKILNTFYTQIEDKWYQKRVLREIEQRLAKSSKAKQSADARWNKTECERIAIKLREESKVKKEDTNVSSNAGSRETSTADLNFHDLQMVHGESLSEFWKAYPNGQNKHNGTRKFIELLCAGIDPKAIIKGASCLSEWVKAETKARGKPPLVRNAPRWLDERGWEDELATAEPQGSKGVNDAWEGFVDIGSSNIADYLN